MKDTIICKNYTFSGNEISSISVRVEKSLPITSLAIDTFEAEVKCREASFLTFQRYEPIKHIRGESYSHIYYLDSVERIGPNGYKITAISPLGLLADMDHYGGIYTGQTVLDVVKNICGPVPVIVKTRLEDIAVYGWLPIAKARDNLAQVLFAINANLGTDKNGVLRVEPLWNGYASYIPAERVYIDNAGVEQKSPVTSVTVLEHRYAPGTTRKDLYEGTTTHGQRITWSEPIHSLSATGFSILESGANYAIVSGGNGKLTGAEYIHNTIEVTRKVSEGQTPNDIRVKNATLVSLANSSVIADSLANYYRCQTAINLDMITLQEKPGEVVKIVNPYDHTVVTAAIASMDETMSNIVKSSVSALVGFTPEASEDFDYYSERAFLSGSGTWHKPDGVSEVTAVLISGGQGGYSGMMGKSATPGNSSNASSTTWKRRVQQISVGFGGDGGFGGAGGTGGKIFRVAFSLNGVSDIYYSCGGGGGGGAANRDRNLAAASDISAPGYAGGDTVFGSYSSAQGAPSESGYYDPITGETFAIPGGAGIAGGKGGGFVDDPTDTSAIPLGDGQAPGPDIVYNGVVYHAGPNNTVMKSAQEGYTSEESILSAGAAYGAGGGAAAGANGNASTDEPSASVVKRSTLSFSQATAIGGLGGQGADAAAPVAQTWFGNGGTGGNGGGGAGGSGFAGVETTKQGLVSSSMPDWPSRVTVEQRSSDISRGLGSDGGQGGPGCIILYYSIGVKKRNGAFTSKKKSFFLDKSGRLFIV